MAAPSLAPFHLAFPVHSLEAARHFYGTVLGLPEGRSTDKWIDFSLYGHQIVAHLAPTADGKKPEPHYNHVDGDNVPVPHFGLVLEWSQWEALAARLKEHEIEFQIAPRIRFEGLPGEQGTFFVFDSSNNALEFKSFKDPSRLFAKQ